MNFFNGPPLVILSLVPFVSVYVNYFQVLGNVEKARQILEAALEKDKASLLFTRQLSHYEGKISADSTRVDKNIT